MTSNDALATSIQDVSDKIDTVHQSILWLSRFIVGACLVILFSIATKWVLFFRIRRMLRRTEELLKIVEAHGKIGDRKAKEIQDGTEKAATAAHEAIKAVKHESRVLAETLPAKVATELKKDSSQDGPGLPTV